MDAWRLAARTEVDGRRCCKNAGQCRIGRAEQAQCRPSECGGEMDQTGIDADDYACGGQLSGEFTQAQGRQGDGTGNELCELRCSAALCRTACRQQARQPCSCKARPAAIQRSSGHNLSSREVAVSSTALGPPTGGDDALCVPGTPLRGR